MNPNMVISLVQLLGPVLIPILTAGTTWLFNKMLGAFSPSTQQNINAFLPAVAGVFGGLLGHLSGMPVSDGVVAGLAGTGIHQLVTQPMKAQKKVA